MILAPWPASDEIDRSIQRRLRLMNGFATTKEMVDALESIAAKHRPRTRRWSRVELLAQACQVELSTFVRQHTILPLRRAITSYQPELAHGSSESASMLRTTCMRLARPGAYLCKSCVSEDTSNTSGRGFAYWRRSHQLPGVYWCAEHQEPLAFLNDDSALDRCPESLLDIAKTLDQSWVSSLRSCNAIQRFVELSEAFLERDQPLPVATVAPILRERAKQLGLNTHRTTRKPLLSDLVLERFPEKWLATIVPKLIGKPHGQIMVGIDGVLYLSTAASSSFVYLLAISVLYDTSDEALADLVITPSAESSTRRPRRSFSSEYWADLNIVEIYVQHLGSAAAAARELSVPPVTVRRQMNAIGLPDLGRLSDDRLRIAATKFFVDGVAWDSVCEQTGVDKAQLEAVVRAAGSNLATALSRMCNQADVKPTGTARPKPPTPLDVQSRDDD